MKAILSAAMVLGLCGFATAADDKKADPVGTWNCEYKIGDMKRTCTLTVTKDGDNLAAVMNWPDQKDVKLKDVKLKDGELTFSAVRMFMDNKIPIDFKFTVAAETLKGKANADFNGTKQEYDIDAKREKKDK